MRSMKRALAFLLMIVLPLFWHQPTATASFDLSARQLWPILPASEAEVMILEYHSITKVPEGALYPDLYVSPETFGKQLQVLYDAGLVGVSFIDAIGQMKAGNFNMSNVVFSFDDGYSDNVWAAKRLDIINYGATFFIPTLYPGKSDKEKSIYYMTWDEIRELFSMGFEIGSHTVTHADLALCHESKIKYEIEQSKKDIETQLESVDDPRTKTPLTFSIPMGSYTSAILDQIKEYGFEGCVTSNPGFMTYDTMQKAQRVKIQENTDMSSVLSHYLRRNLKKEGNLKRGMKGERIKSFRTILTRLGYPLAQDDYFDQKMELAIKEFQRDFNLKDNGILNGTTVDRMVSDFVELVVGK